MSNDTSFFNDLAKQTMRTGIRWGAAFVIVLILSAALIAATQSGWGSVSFSLQTLFGIVSFLAGFAVGLGSGRIVLRATWARLADGARVRHAVQLEMGHAGIAAVTVVLVQAIEKMVKIFAQGVEVEAHVMDKVVKLLNAGETVTFGVTVGLLLATAILFSAQYFIHDRRDNR